MPRGGNECKENFINPPFLMPWNGQPVLIKSFFRVTFQVLTLTVFLIPQSIKDFFTASYLQTLVHGTCNELGVQKVTLFLPNLHKMNKFMPSTFHKLPGWLETFVIVYFTHEEVERFFSFGQLALKLNYSSDGF